MGDLGSIPGSGRSLGGGRGSPLQYSCLENPHGQRSLVDYSPWSCKESNITEQLSTAQQECMEFHIYSTLLLLSGFSHVQPCATPEMAAHQAPSSLGFSRQEHWSGLPFPSAIYGLCLVTQLCLTLCSPMDCSLPSSSAHGDSPGKSTGVG